ncbi:hypothetical protein L7F22_002983 [Adiantum nelumboides]|nr:hypothetical protein [Adiantum nelumboides]
MSASSFDQPFSQQLRRKATQAHRTTLADSVGTSTSTKNVIVLGGSYGGMHAATVLANKLPPSHRVILIERNSHFNHLYVFPRFSTLPGHEHKAFIPYTSIFKDAPSRSSGTTQPVAGSSKGHNLPVEKHEEIDDGSRTTDSSQASLLGMGSLGGQRLRSKMSNFSDSSDGSRYLARSRFGGSSASRSSSVDDNASIFDNNDYLRIRQSRRGDEESSPSSSASSSYLSHSSERMKEQDGERDRAAKLAGSEGMEHALSIDAEASRAEENLGRPEIEVEELSKAIEKGIDMEDVPSDNNTQTFEGSSPHLVLQANVTNITSTHVEVESVVTSSSKSVWSIDKVAIPFSHIVYALGSHLPDPLRTESRTKSHGVEWMQKFQKRVKDSQEIVLVGGGALGVEFATDIKSVYPEKSVTLIHSRKQLLPNFDAQVHEIANKRLEELGVNVVLGERLALTEGCPRGSSVKQEEIDAFSNDHRQGEVCPPSANKGGEGERARNEGMCLGNGRKKVKTTHGKEFECDLLLLCTGQQPNSGLMAHLSPTSVDPSTRLVRVMRTLQVKVPDPNGSLAQMPFDARPPCGDCDCFLDKKAAGADDDQSTVAKGKDHDSTLSNVYAIGDVADAFGALNAGYQAWSMADIAAENIIRDISNSSLKPNTEKTSLQHFDPAANMLKLSLGLGKMVFQGAPDEKTGRPTIEVREDPSDLAVEGVWQFMAGMSTDDMYI